MISLESGLSLVIIVLLVGGFIYWLHSAKGHAELATLKSDVTGAISKAEANLKAHVTAATTAPVPAPVPVATPVAPAPAAPVAAPPKQNVTEALLGSPAGSTVQLATPATNQPGFSPSPPGAA